MARNEINIVKGLLPQFAGNPLIEYLDSADERIFYASQVFAAAETAPGYYCVVDSSFDGQFAGRGKTELEARDNAVQACKRGSRRNGFFCDESRRATCQREQ
jgi:hypothetical protein